MTERPADRAGALLPGNGPAFTLAWFSLLLVVVFTIAFWLGRTVGPEPAQAEPTDPVAPHTSGTHR